MGLCQKAFRRASRTVNGAAFIGVGNVVACLTVGSVFVPVIGWVATGPLALATGSMWMMGVSRILTLGGPDPWETKQ